MNRQQRSTIKAQYVAAVVTAVLVGVVHIVRVIIRPRFAEFLSCLLGLLGAGLLVYDARECEFLLGLVKLLVILVVANVFVPMFDREVMLTPPLDDQSDDELE